MLAQVPCCGLDELGALTWASQVRAEMRKESGDFGFFAGLCGKISGHIVEHGRLASL